MFFYTPIMQGLLTYTVCIKICIGLCLLKINYICLNKLYIFTIYLLKKFVVNISCLAACIYLNSKNLSNVIFRQMTFEHAVPYKISTNFRKMTRRFVTKHSDQSHGHRRGAGMGSCIQMREP